MTLSLTVIKYAGRTPPTPVMATFGEAGGVIGRQPGCDWVLEDPEGHVSKRHGRIDCVSGQYRITDTSTNGVFLNDTGNRIGYGASTVLKDGDRLYIGSYEIAVQVSGIVPAQAAEEEEDPFGLGRYQDPMAPPPPPSQADRNAAFFDAGPLTSEKPEQLPSSDDWLFSPTPDHAPIEQLAIQLPPAIPPPPPPPRRSAVGRPTGGSPAGGILPSNWNPLDDDDEVAAPAVSDPPPAALKQVPPPPAIAQVQPPAAFEQASPPPALDQPEPPALAPDLPPPPVARSKTRIERGARGEASAMDLIQAFLEGAGLGTELLAHAEPEAVLQAAGQRLRELVAGMRALLAARSQIKTELRVEQTMISALDNNPLKLSVDDEQALTALLTAARPGYLAPDVAIKRSFQDLQAHELALLAGARTAVAEALAPFAPETLMKGVKGRALLASSQKAKYWDLFEAEFKKLREAGEDDPHGPLARALARAYEDQGRKQ